MDWSATDSRWNTHLTHWVTPLVSHLLTEATVPTFTPRKPRVEKFEVHCDETRPRCHELPSRHGSSP